MLYLLPRKTRTKKFAFQSVIKNFPIVPMSSVPLSKFLKPERSTWKGESLRGWGSAFPSLGQLCPRWVWGYSLVFSRCFSELNINNLCRGGRAESPLAFQGAVHLMPREGIKLGQGTAERCDLVAKAVKCWLVELDFIPLSSCAAWRLQSKWLELLT